MSRRSRDALDPVERLGLFAHEVEELGRRRLVANGMDNTFTVQWNRMEGLRLSLTEHDEEDLRSFLVAFRKFVSKGEPVYLDSIYNLCETHITSEDLRGRLRQSRQAWKDAQRGSGIKIVYNERDLTPTHVMDLWINGFYFHSDASKAAELRAIWPSELARFQFTNFLVDATRQVLYVGNVVRCSLKEGLVTP